MAFGHGQFITAVIILIFHMDSPQELCSRGSPAFYLSGQAEPARSKVLLRRTLVRR